MEVSTHCDGGSCPASTCCVCRFPLPRYCESHFRAHLADSEFFSHSRLPLSAQAQITTKPAWIKLRARLLNLHNAYVDLRENQALVDTCDEELKKVQGRYREAFPQFADSLQPLSTRLDALRRAFFAEIEAATKATTEAAVTGATFPPETLCALVQAYEDDPDRMKVFSYEVVVTERSLKVAVKVRFGTPLQSLRQWNTDCELQLDIRQAVIEQNRRIEDLERQKEAELPKSEQLRLEGLRLQQATEEIERLGLSEDESIQSLEFIQTPARSSVDDSYELISNSDIGESPLQVQSEPPAVDGEIAVRTPFGSVFPVDFSPEFTIENVKYKLAPLCGIPVSQQVLRFAGRALQDQKTLRDYGVTKNAVLNLSLRPAAKDSHFYVRTDYGEVYWIPYHPLMTIAAVKQRICREHNVPEEIQELRFVEEELMDECALKDYKIPRGGNLFLRVSQRVFPIRAVLPNHSPLEVKCTFRSTVKDLKHRIWELTGLCDDFQRLSFNGKVLEDSRIVGLCGVHGGCEIVVTYQQVTLSVQIGSQVWPVTCDYLNTIGELKQELAEVTGHAKELIRLTYAESLLDESKTIGECNLRQGFKLRALVGFPDHNEVYVRTLTGDVVTLEHQEFETVRTVKGKLAPLTNHSELSMTLVHAGRPLDDRKTLHDCSVNKGTVIYLAS